MTFMNRKEQMARFQILLWRVSNKIMSEISGKDIFVLSKYSSSSLLITIHDVFGQRKSHAFSFSMAYYYYIWWWPQALEYIKAGRGKKVENDFWLALSHLACHFVEEKEMILFPPFTDIVSLGPSLAKTWVTSCKNPLSSIVKVIIINPWVTSYFSPVLKAFPFFTPWKLLN